jgi:tetratricopeptide (TPR) repeat protein
VTEVITRAQALRAVGLSERQLREWEKAGLIEPAVSYTFTDIVSLRTLARLKASKISTRRMHSMFDTVRKKLREVANPLAELKIDKDGRRIHVQFGTLKMDASSGQLLLDFADAQIRQLLEIPQEQVKARAAERKRREAENWFQRGIELEQTGGPLDQAMDAYKVALALDPVFAAAMVNLGTLYFTARHLDQAEKYYRRAVDANPDYPLAHFNLGNLCDERGDRARALDHYLIALKLDGNYADAHYNLALLYQGRGETLKAVRHWRTYLRLDPQSPWADIARRELRKLYDASIVDGRRSQTS